MLFSSRRTTTTTTSLIISFVFAAVDINKWYALSVSSSSSSSASSILGVRRSYLNTIDDNCKSDTLASSSQLIVSKGLQNLGNTCYMNAQLQCAFHIPHIRTLILNKNNGDENQSPGLYGLQCVFQSMLQQSQEGGERNSGSASASAHVLCRSLGINPMEQQDAQEFWKLLLPQLPKAVIDTYTGSYEDYIVACDGTGRTRRKETPFVDLSLEVPPIEEEDGNDDGSTTTTLMNSFRTMFQTPELLSVDEGNGWKPPPTPQSSNTDKVDALKGQLLHRQGLPSLLQVHLKRFQYDWRTHTITKLNNRYTFPEELDLSDIVVTDDDTMDTTPTEQNIFTKYVLQSVIVHAGPYGSGHYYSYCRPMLEENAITNGDNNKRRHSQWYRFDDDKVTQVTFEEVITDAYGGSSSSSSSSSSDPNKRCKRKKEQNCNKDKKQGRLHDRFFQWLASSTIPFSTTCTSSYGYGGRESCAYVLQYVRKCDIPSLYK